MSAAPVVLFIDCEYNGWGGGLISMALVPLDPNALTFYEVAAYVTPLEPWVRHNVEPLLEPGRERLTNVEFAQALSRYLARFSAIHVVADWPEDIELFCRALITGPGERVDTPPLTMEVRRDIDTGASAVPHHAFHDAVALRRSWLDAEAEAGRVPA